MGLESRCIDENTASRLVQGLLSEEERAGVERHLDSCPTCSRVMAEVARIFHGGGPSSLAVAATVAVVPSGLTHLSPAPGPAPDVGAEVGRYRIERVLAAGGMGVVYVAFDPALGRRVALKLLKPELLAGERVEEASQRLAREAQAMARISSPHVVPVYDVGTFQGRPFLAMELVQGATLREWLRLAPRSFGEILAMFRQAGEGLAAAHAAGLVHRDFKPENVLVTFDGCAKVSDFGLTRADAPARAVADPYRAGADGAGPPLPADPLTRTGAVMGTPAYMSPEQFFGQPTDLRSDLFSFAASLYEALYATRPYPATSLHELEWRLASGRIEPPKGQSRVPGWVLPVLRRSLATDPAARHPSMQALLEALSDAEARRARLHLAANLVVQSILLFAHFWMLTIMVVALVHSGDSPATAVPAAPTPSSGEYSGPWWDLFAWFMVMVLFANVFWAPVGAVWVPINLYGMARKRPWARVSSLVYAVFALPTCFGTPYALYAFFSLTRGHVKRLFEVG